MAERLTGALRPGDSLARLSGDEFVVLCEDLEDPSQANAIAERIEGALARPFILSGVEMNLTASIGIAFTGQGSEAPEELLHDADLAMYRTKRTRDRGHDVLDLRELHLAGYQSGLARALPGAQQRGEMHLAYQPIVDTSDGQITDVEALLRWTHPARGSVPPTVFIPFAEQSGQIIELGRWVLEQACSAYRGWESQGSDLVALSVNVSAHQFMSAGFAEIVAGVLSSESIDPRLLTQEVTESVFVRDEDRALIVLGELKQIGVKLALDDFGTGYSSLAYLNTLPIDRIKVDHTFISKLSDDPDSQRIVTAIIALGHSLGITTSVKGSRRPSSTTS